MANAIASVIVHSRGEAEGFMARGRVNQQTARTSRIGRLSCLGQTKRSYFDEKMPRRKSVYRSRGHGVKAIRILAQHCAAGSGFLGGRRQ